MKLNSRLKRIGLFSVVICLITTLIVFKDVQEYSLNAIKTSLDYEGTYQLVIVGSAMLGLFYSFYFAKSKQPKELRFFMKVFGPLIDPPLNTLAYGLVIASVLRLIRGLFNQIFFEIEYFKDFGFINVSAIGLACIPLLIWSVNGLTGYFLALFGTVDTQFGEITPIKGDDNSEEVIVRK